MKSCTNCEKQRPIADFHHYGGRTGKWCEECYARLIGRRLQKRRHYGVKRRALLQRAQPAWADSYKIAKIYARAALLSQAGIPHHVDHVIPLMSPKVCGLHCPRNLRIRPAAYNLAKGNRFVQ